MVITGGGRRGRGLLQRQTIVRPVLQSSLAVVISTFLFPSTDFSSHFFKLICGS